MRRISWLAAVGSVGLVSALALASPPVAEAHETRTIGDGQYQIVVGFMNEPVFAGDKSGLEFWVTEVSAATPGAGDEEGTPVEGLEETLQAEVIYEDQTMELPLTAKADHHPKERHHLAGVSLYSPCGNGLPQWQRKRSSAVEAKG
jgi:hypothetical protein